MNLFKLTYSFLKGKTDKNPIDVLYELKDTISRSLNKYRCSVDTFKVKEIYDEVRLIYLIS